MTNSGETLSASLEDYMEAIFHIVEKKQAARAKDISERLNVKGSSVTVALRHLADRDLINYAPYDIITLTPKGKRIAQDVVCRHETLRDFFVKILAIGETEAEATACKMEHSVSETVLTRLTQFIEFLETCPRGGYKWLEGFGTFCEHGINQEQCEKCLSECLKRIREQSCSKEMRDKE